MTSRRVDCPTRARRLVWLIFWGGLAGGLLMGAFPGFLANPMAPQLAFEGLRGLISEVAPLFPDTPKRTSAFLITLSGLLFAVPVLLWQLARHRGAQLGALWWLVACLGLVYLPLALWQMRFSLFLSVPLAIALAVLVGRSFGNLGPWTARPARALLCAILLALPLTLQQAHLQHVLGGRAEAIRSEPGCEIGSIAPFLNGAAPEVAGERIIVSPLGYATALLYFTRHAVVGTAYHRNVAGTRDTYGLLESVDQTAALALVRRRGIDLFLLCARAMDTSFRPTVEGRATLYRRLQEARPPAWLHAVTLPEGLGQDFKLYSVTIPEPGAPLR